MIRTMITLFVAATLGTAATDAGAARAASIPFADLGNIRDWRAEGHDAMLIESQRGQWFRATFFAPCFELPFAEQVGFVTDATGRLDRFSSILVNGERCYFRSFEEIAPPGN